MNQPATLHRVPSATPRQVNFIRTLLAERSLSERDRGFYLSLVTNDLTMGDASKLIDRLLKLPRVPNAAAAASSVGPAGSLHKELYAALEQIPNSRYAVPVSEVDEVLSRVPSNNDLIFLRKAVYKERHYIRRLSGAPGRFTASSIPIKDAIILANRIASDPLKYSRLFGEHYTCCGVCGAELTDPVSREHFMGPTCRKTMGLVV